MKSKQDSVLESCLWLLQVGAVLALLLVGFQDSSTNIRKIQLAPVSDSGATGFVTATQ